jgi:alkyl hydroperoxide reductase subunit AhpC
LIGEIFLKVEVKTTFGPMVVPRDFAGKWSVLFSHPADFTSMHLRVRGLCDKGEEVPG